MKPPEQDHGEGREGLGAEPGVPEEQEQSSGEPLPPSPAGSGTCPAPHIPARRSANRMSERQARGGPGAWSCICCGGLWGRLDIVLQEKPL